LILAFGAAADMEEGFHGQEKAPPKMGGAKLGATT